MMMGSYALAVTIMLIGTTAWLAFAASREWAKLATDRDGPIPVHQLRAASAMTGIALKAICLALLWLTFAMIWGRYLP